MITVKQFVAYPMEVVRSKNLTCEDKTVFLVILSFNPSFPSYDKLCELAGMSRNRLLKSLKNLEERRLIKRIKDGRRITYLPYCRENEIPDGQVVQFKDEKKPSTAEQESQLQHSVIAAEIDAALSDQEKLSTQDFDAPSSNSLKTIRFNALPVSKRDYISINLRLLSVSKRYANYIKELDSFNYAEDDNFCQETQRQKAQQRVVQIKTTKREPRELTFDELLQKIAVNAGV